MKYLLSQNTGKKGLRALFLGALILSSCGTSSSSSFIVETTSEDGGWNWEDDDESSSYVEATLEDNPSPYALKGISNEGSDLSYEIFVPAFYDTNGDKIGDFNGIAQKASYLKSLGIGRVWLMPIHPTSTYHGYDVNDFYGVNSRFGSMNDFENMVSTLKRNGIDTIIDMVLNHSGRDNPWFREALYDYKNNNNSDTSKKDWYVFSRERTSVCTHEYDGIYYEGRFDSSMPEFNYDSSSWRSEVKNILNFWLDKGVAGFRLDAVRYYHYGSDSGNIEVLDYFREATKEKYPNAYFVGENWERNSSILSYYGSKMDSYFSFDQSIAYDNSIALFAKGNEYGSSLFSRIEDFIDSVKEKNPNAYPSFFLSNHDTDRSSKYLYNEEDAKLAFSVLNLLPGSPYTYYGEEILLKGERGSEMTDGMRRLPMIWSESNKTGECNAYDSAVSHLYSDYNQVKKGVDDLEAVSSSLINHIKRVGEVRNQIEGMDQATIEALNTGDYPIAGYKLLAGKKTYYVLHNNSDQSLSYTLSGFKGRLFDSIDASGKKPKLDGESVSLGGKSSIVLLAS